MSELRQDLVSGDWIIMAPERAKRPHELLPKKKARISSPKSECPLEDLQESGNWPLIRSFPNAKRWKVAIIPNKYPALRHAEECAQIRTRGPYQFDDGIGQHDLVITRDHRKNLAHLTLSEGVQVFELLQKHYRSLAADSCLLYVSTFFNWGASAGASLYHPHFQILSLPIIPPDIGHSLGGSRDYFKKHGTCVHCDMLAYEAKSKKRIIEQNTFAVAAAPYVSREPFEVRLYPKAPRPYFEKMPLAELRGVVAVLQSSLRRIEKYLRDPDLNFFIHTSPVKNENLYGHYHWHIEILPKGFSIPAGFEFGTGVDINVVDPDQAAAILRGEKI